MWECQACFAFKTRYEWALASPCRTSRPLCCSASPWLQVNLSIPACQLLEACGMDDAPRYLLRDRDAIYGNTFRWQVTGLNIEEVLIAPRSPWQNPYVERVIGSIRRECLDHTIVLGERHLRRIIRNYVNYYNNVRTHLSLVKDAPDRRPVQAPKLEKIVSRRYCGGLHHEYFRTAA